MMLCRAPGVRVLVDAAHALGQQEIDVAALHADYVTGNCHKWLCGPRGSAVLWAAARHHARLRPLVVSHGHGHGFTSDFIWDGAPPPYACGSGPRPARLGTVLHSESSLCGTLASAPSGVGSRA